MAGAAGAGIRDRLAALVGAPDALVVNNCAAAVLLALTALAHDRDVLVSRGELVEIGGGFRVPAVITASGARLREVGTTNRTHLRDFSAALDDRVAAVLSVHHSNFRQIGFVAQPTWAELAALGPPLVVDLGSGALFPGEEPSVQGALEAGAALVCFSGDKLLGGRRPASSSVPRRGWSGSGATRSSGRSASTRPSTRPSRARWTPG
ncbi:MAG: hypothetical protein R3F60_25225 [bacterium]